MVVGFWGCSWCGSDVIDGLLVPVSLLGSAGGACPFFRLSGFGRFRFASGRQRVLFPVFDLLFAGGGSFVAVSIPFLEYIVW